MLIHPQERSTNRFMVSRRRLLASVVGAGLGLALPEIVAGRENPSPEEAFPNDPKKALKRLAAGNKRFVAGEPLHNRSGKEVRKELVSGQQPFAAILGCSDSRVPPELVFDQGLGDLFIVRNAGNVVAADVLGSLQYAGLHLKIQLLVVLGHESCGAVTAALDVKSKREKHPERIEALLHMIEPGLKDLDPKLTGKAQLNAAVEANVRWSMRQMAELPEAKKALEEKHFEMVGAVYQLETGAVRFLS
jgi:carbonic anhydrase